MHFGLLLFSSLVFCFSGLKNNSLSTTVQQNETVYAYFDKKLVNKPRLEDNARLSDWVNNNMTITDAQLEKQGAHTAVTVKCIIDAEGNLTETKIAFGVGGELDEYALKLIKACPHKWLPGETQKERVATEVYFKIDFKSRIHEIVNEKNEHQDLKVKF